MSYIEILDSSSDEGEDSPDPVGEPQHETAVAPTGSLEEQPAGAATSGALSYNSPHLPANVIVWDALPQSDFATTQSTSGQAPPPKRQKSEKSDPPGSAEVSGQLQHISYPSVLLTETTDSNEQHLERQSSQELESAFRPLLSPQ